MTSTKISGLGVDSEYSFYLVLKTSGGTYTSNTLTVKTHAMNNLTGITVTPGVLPPQLRESLEAAVERIGARIVETVRIDTTHFVCTEGRGREWERANEMNIPVVRPEWIEGCEREGRIIGVRGYYLDADPRQRQVGSNPSLSANRSSISAQAAPAPQQANIPERPKDPTPKSPDQESTVSGEPGPEVHPTSPPAPPEKELPPPPANKDEEENSEAAEDEGAEAEAGEPAEAREAEDEPQTAEDPHENEAASSDDADKDEQSSEEENQQAKVEDGKEGTDMEDVAL